MTGTEKKDERGLFVELLKDKDISRYKQISLLTIEPNFFRGMHYHKFTKEAFMLLEGDCKLVYYYGRDEDSKFYNDSTVVEMEKYNLVEVLPDQEHVLLSKNGAKLLALSEHEFNPKNPDVYVYNYNK